MTDVSVTGVDTPRKGTNMAYRHKALSIWVKRFCKLLEDDKPHRPKS